MYIVLNVEMFLYPNPKEEQVWWLALTVCQIDKEWA